jgi:hypothetical protein
LLPVSGSSVLEQERVEPSAAIEHSSEIFVVFVSERLIASEDKQCDVVSITTSLSPALA